MRHYNLATNNSRGFEKIADAIDRVIRHEIGDLVDDHSDYDVLPSHPANDPEWVLARHAAPILGITNGNVIAAVHRGALEGRMGWLADGGWRRGTGKPTHPQMFVARSSIERRLADQALPCLKDRMRATGMSERAVKANFIETGMITARALADRVVVDVPATRRLLDALVAGLIASFPSTGALTVKQLTSRFNKRHGHLFRDGRATERWVAHWLELLVHDKRVRARLDDHFTFAPGDDGSPRSLARPADLPPLPPGIVSQLQGEPS
jgi:hypothetical protein